MAKKRMSIYGASKSKKVGAGPLSPSRLAVVAANTTLNVSNNSGGFVSGIAARAAGMKKRR